MILSHIVAVANHGVIGKEGKLAWHLKPDLQYFKKLTTGHTIIMGRKTYDSIGRPLPNRRNIVISRQMPAVPGIEIARSLEEALSLADAPEKECFIIGGSQLYTQSLPITKRIYFTKINLNVDGDTYYPKDWATEFVKTYESTPETWENISFQFQIFERPTL